MAREKRWCDLWTLQEPLLRSRAPAGAEIAIEDSGGEDEPPRLQDCPPGKEIPQPEVSIPLELFLEPGPVQMSHLVQAGGGGGQGQRRSREKLTELNLGHHRGQDSDLCLLHCRVVGISDASRKLRVSSHGDTRPASQSIQVRQSTIIRGDIIIFPFPVRPLPDTMTDVSFSN